MGKNYSGYFRVGLVGSTVLIPTLLLILLFSFALPNFRKSVSAKDNVWQSSMDLSIATNHNGDFIDQVSGYFYITVTNEGEDFFQYDSVVVTDNLPSVFTLEDISGSGWDFFYLGNIITAEYRHFISLENGESLPTIIIKATPNIMENIIVTNTVGVTYFDDNNISNNISTDRINILDIDTCDLEVSMSYFPYPLEGGLITYTIVVTNNGPIIATGVRLTDTFPTSDVTFTSYSVSPSSTSYNSSTGVWSIGTMAEGVSKTLQLIGRINLGTDGDTIKNTASGLTSDNVDNDLTNNSDSVSFVVGGAPDLQVYKTDYQTSFSPGDEFTYTIFITNTGSEDATGIVITDVLPAYINYITDTLRTLGITFTYPTARTYRWDYPFDIEAGDTITFELGVKAASAMTGLTQVNNVEVSTTTSEGNTSNNSASDTDTITYPPNTIFSKSIYPSSARKDDDFTFFIFVTNDSEYTMSNIVVKDNISPYLNIYDISSSRGVSSFNNSTHKVTVNLGTLNAGSSATISIYCRVENVEASTISLYNYALMTYTQNGQSLSKTTNNVEFQIIGAFKSMFLPLIFGQ